MRETILYEYKAGIRRAYTTSLIVWSVVSGMFWFGAYSLWGNIIRGTTADAPGLIVAGILTVIPYAFLRYIITRRPRSFLLIRRDDGLSLRWHSGREVRVASTKALVSSFVIDRDYGNPYGACVVKTATRRKRTRLCFHQHGEAIAFEAVLARQKGRR